MFAARQNPPGEETAHYLYPMLDEALDSPVVRAMPGFHLRIHAYELAVKAPVFFNRKASDAAHTYHQEQGVVDYEPFSLDRLVSDVKFAARDAGRITVGANNRLKTEGVHRSERAEIMKQSPKILGISANTAKSQTKTIVPLPSPVARLLTAPFKSAVYVTPYAYPARAFVFDRKAEELKVSQSYFASIRSVRREMRREDIADVTGCPAGRIVLDTDEGRTTMLIEFWKKYVDAIYSGNSLARD